MASELTVQTLRGPTSGANANTVLIPSGQTLDASEGTITPSADQIVQYKITNPSSSTTFANGSYGDAAGFTLTITPKYASSKILIRAWAKAAQTNSASGNSAHSHRLTRSGTEIYTGNWVNYFNTTWATSDFYPPFAMSYIDQPNTTSSITYQVQGRIYSGNQLGWIINDGNGGSVRATMEVLEIKQ